MKESIHKYFQVGTIQWMSYPQRDPMESLKAICKDDFFDAIELKGLSLIHILCKCFDQPFIRTSFRFRSG